MSTRSIRMTITMPCEMASVVETAVDATTTHPRRGHPAGRARLAGEARNPAGLRGAQDDIQRGLADLSAGWLKGLDADRIAAREGSY